MKEADKNEIKVLINSEAKEIRKLNEDFTKDQRNFAFRIVSFCITLLGIVTYFGLDSYIINTVDNKIGETALQQYRSRLDAASEKAEEKIDSLNNTLIRIKGIYTQLERESKKIGNSGITNYMYVNHLGNENGTVKIDNIPSDLWVNVPYNNATQKMNFILNVKNTDEIYLIVYSYRVKHMEAGNSKSAVLIAQSNGRVKELYGDGNELNKGNGNIQYSGAFIVKDLKPGKYDVGLFDYFGNSSPRIFDDPRQLVVYKLF